MGWVYGGFNWEMASSWAGSGGVSCVCLLLMCTSSYLWALMRYENADELRMVMRADGVF